MNNDLNKLPENDGFKSEENTGISKETESEKSSVKKDEIVSDTEKEPKEEAASETNGSEEKVEDATEDSKKEEEKSSTEVEKVSDDDTSDDLDEDDNENDTEEEIDEIDHESLSKEQLVIRLKHLIDSIPLTSRNLKDEIEKIKNTFYEKFQHEVSVTHEKFIADGGEEKDFKMPPDPQEQLLSELIADYRRKRYEILKKFEEEKELNLLAKKDVIEGIKELIQSEESINNTFNNFRELQKRWKEIGPVPQSNVRNLYESYHHSIEMFYDYIKINKDLRDLDLKKNQEAKEHLCEVAEELINEENAVSAFNNLQELHKEWREIGPVPKEFKEPLWERFKEATAKINKKHQQYYDDIKENQKENLEKKTALCEKVEEIAGQVYERPKVWNKKSQEIIGIQKEWRTIGFAPRKYNNKIYERFRKACDEFFDNKRKYYQEYKKLQDDNLEKKQALVNKALALKDSEDWKKATSELVRIQKEWKKIGPVPRKHSDSIWNDFRNACDHFFNRKKEFFHDIDKVQDDNLKLKKKLIDEINAFEPEEDNEKTIGILHDFKERWNSIGHVPFRDKDAIYNEYRNAINRHFDKLNMDETKREVEKYKSKIEDIQVGQRSDDKLNSERNKLLNKYRTLENDIAVWENNIGFLSTGKKSGSVVKDYERKIEKAKERLEILKRKIDLLNDMQD
ncbi:DUF349 domain-containing protein [Saccharicrinis sp. FJH54]|uniref:DUF349 domain-containing protein n=1 Tax=Saccharicrinis sp. FJH54 TaxID=3344665 RepID=UPI0035D499D4